MRSLDKEQRGDRVTYLKCRVKVLDREGETEAGLEPAEHSVPGVQFLVRNVTIPTRQSTFRWSNRIVDVARPAFLGKVGSRD